MQLPGAVIEGIWDSGKEGIGKIHIMTDSPEKALESDGISVKLRGTVLVAGRINNSDPIRQAEESGIRGIIAGSIPTPLIPSATSLSIPIFITDGIGYMPMADIIYDLLVKLQGNMVTLFSQQTAAPGSRPMLAIPLQTKEAVQPQNVEDMPIEVGHQVRLLREPHRGAIGSIVQLYQHGKKNICRHSRFWGRCSTINWTTIICTLY